MDLVGKTVLVTGAARRIGRAIAIAFLEAGSKVLIHYHETEPNLDVPAYSADLTQSTAVQKLANTIIKEHGGIDVLVNNASQFFPTPFGDIDEAYWELFFAIHVKAPFYLAQSFAPAMRARGGGRIVNLADAAAERPRKDYLPYQVSKQALLALTKGLAKELAPDILVNTICPGPILPPENDSQIVTKLPLGKWGTPEDIARAAVFLAEQDFSTGSCITVDGGESLR